MTLKLWCYKHKCDKTGFNTLVFCPQCEEEPSASGKEASGPFYYALLFSDFSGGITKNAVNWCSSTYARLFPTLHDAQRRLATYVNQDMFAIAKISCEKEPIWTSTTQIKASVKQQRVKAATGTFAKWRVDDAKFIEWVK